MVKATLGVLLKPFVKYISCCCVHTYIPVLVPVWLASIPALVHHATVQQRPTQRVGLNSNRPQVDHDNKVCSRAPCQGSTHPWAARGHQGLQAAVPRGAQALARLPAHAQQQPGADACRWRGRGRGSGAGGDTRALQPVSRTVSPPARACTWLLLRVKAQRWKLAWRSI